MPTVAPFGSWKSPITSDQLVEAVVGLAYPLVSGEEIYWLESRPNEGGRQTILRADAAGTVEEVLPKEFAARTLVHEYGGLPYAVHGDVVFFSNMSDQRLYRLDRDGTATALTPDPPQPMAWRYAAPVVSPDGRFLICVRERHGEEVLNDLVLIETARPNEARVLAQGHDFYSSPAISPDGTRLCWLQWDHPRMPWNGTELLEGSFDESGSLGEIRVVCGGDDESIAQPSYSPTGVLHFISDRSDWWNLYEDDGRDGKALAPTNAEFASPDWVFGLANYAFCRDRLVASWLENGFGHLGVLDRAGARFEEINTEYQFFGGLQAYGDRLLAITASAAASPVLGVIDLDRADVHVVAQSRTSSVDVSYLSAPQAIEFETGNGQSAFGLYYPPKNPDFIGPPGELPPLIVGSHGGPTSASVPVLSYSTQYWTSRGFGVIDVNYGGSSGYGRQYRERLRDSWGIVDVEDCTNAAKHLARIGEVDPNRLLIHGGSAGGYTTLCAATFRTEFAAGASYFGVADAGALARDTHKFESRYLDQLIGSWPEDEALYKERSPIFHTDKLSTPLILFQGLEDKVVPPNQAEMMLEALRTRGAPVAYLAYEGEQHGFRRAENIKRTAEAELYFYGKILGFEPADEIEPVTIENLATTD